MIDPSAIRRRRVAAWRKIMEKNGNTVVPGDEVTSTKSAGKTAGVNKGVVRPETSDGRVKVAWGDGTESWERPEDLNKSR
jgi:hypothetical protein